MSTTTKYVAGPNSGFGNDKAQQIADILQSAQQRGEEATPKVLVDAARAEGHPLHDLFEWRTDVAAEEHRLSQARHHIGSIQMIVIDLSTNQEVQKYRGFQSLVLQDARTTAERPKPQYLTTKQVLGDQSMREQMVNTAIREIKSWCNKYKSTRLTELQPLFDAIDSYNPPQPGV